MSMKTILLTLLLLSIGGCSTVQPWERGTLAKREMQWQSDVMEANLQQQIQTSKEASSGGEGAAGGGCGCN